MPDIPRTRSEKCGLERRYNDFKAGRPIVRDGVRDFILDSWLRCRKSFPKQEAPRLHFVQGRELEDRILRNGFILKNAAPIMQSVFDLLTGPDVGIKGVECCVFIADKGYVLLKSLSSGSFPIKEGFVFDEELIGTNSVYSCILNRYIATVYGLEHYFGAFAGYVASSSPIITEDGTMGRAASPSGISAGEHEAMVLRDGDRSRYDGNGVRKAVEMAEKVVLPAIRGMDVLDQQALDRRLMELDGTTNKSRLGGNVTYSTSLAVMRAGCQLRQIGRASCRERV